MVNKPELNFEEAIFDQWAGDLKKIEQPLPVAAFWLVGVGGLLMIVLVIIRVLVLNVYFGDFYQKRAAINVHQEFIIPAHRGVIVDRFDNQLVKNLPSFSVSINKAELLKDRDRNAVAVEVGKTLNIPLLLLLILL